MGLWGNNIDPGPGLASGYILNLSVKQLIPPSIDRSPPHSSELCKEFCQPEVS